MAEDEEVARVHFRTLSTAGQLDLERATKGGTAKSQWYENKNSEMNRFLKLTMSWQRKLRNEHLQCPVTPDAFATLRTLQNIEFGDAGIAGWGRADCTCGDTQVRVALVGRSHNKTVGGWISGKARQRLAGGNSWECPRTTSGLGGCHLVFASSLMHSTCHTLHFTFFNLCQKKELLLDWWRQGHLSSKEGGPLSFALLARPQKTTRRVARKGSQRHDGEWEGRSERGAG